MARTNLRMPGEPCNGRSRAVLTSRSAKARVLPQSPGTRRLIVRLYDDHQLDAALDQAALGRPATATGVRSPVAARPQADAAVAGIPGAATMAGSTTSGSPRLPPVARGPAGGAIRGIRQRSQCCAHSNCPIPVRADSPHSARLPKSKRKTMSQLRKLTSRRVARIAGSVPDELLGMSRDDEAEALGNPCVHPRCLRGCMHRPMTPRDAVAGTCDRPRIS